MPSVSNGGTDEREFKPHRKASVKKLGSVSVPGHNFLPFTDSIRIIFQDDLPTGETLRRSQSPLERSHGTGSFFFSFADPSFGYVSEPWLVTIPLETSLKLYRRLVNS